MRLGIVIRCCRNFGSSRYVIETSKYFVKKHHLEIFTNNWDPLNPKIKIHKIPTVPYGFYVQEASFCAFATAAMKLQKFDVTLAQPTRYFTPDVGEMQFVYRAWANYKRNNGIPITLGDRTLPRIENYNIKRAKQIITIAQCVKDEVLRYYKLPEERVNVVYSGVNLEDFNPKNKSRYSEEIKKKYGIADDELVLIFVGNPFHRKGLKYTIEALAKVRNKNYKLLIVGKDNNTPYIDLTSRLGVENKIIFVGLTSEIVKYFSASDIFILPTLYEPFGLVILEAMAFGLPVITSKLAGAAELIDNGKDGFCLENPKDVSEISEKLNYLIESKNSREAMGRSARKKAEKHSWERTAKEMMEVFEKAARR